MDDLLLRPGQTGVVTRSSNGKKKRRLPPCGRRRFFFRISGLFRLALLQFKNQA